MAKAGSKVFSSLGSDIQKGKDKACFNCESQFLHILELVQSSDLASVEIKWGWLSLNAREKKRSWGPQEDLKPLRPISLPDHRPIGSNTLVLRISLLLSLPLILWSHVNDFLIYLMLPFAESFSLHPLSDSIEWSSPLLILFLHPLTSSPLLGMWN